MDKRLIMREEQKLENLLQQVIRDCADDFKSEFLDGGLVTVAAMVKVKIEVHE